MNQKIQREIVGVVIVNFKWDEDFIPPEVKVCPAKRSLYLKEDDYVFRTVLGKLGLMEGIHYWEIVADARSEHEMKLGVSTSN